MFIFYKIHGHYEKVAEQLRLENDTKLHDYDGNTVLVLAGDMTRVNIGALNYIRPIGDYVVAMHASLDENVEKEEEIEAESKKHFPDVRFSTVYFSYCSIENPIIRCIDIVSKDTVKQNYTTTVLTPQSVPNRRRQDILHN